MRARACCFGLVFALCSGLALAEETKKAAGPLCPVSGKPAKLSSKTMTMTDAGPVYFCCEGCPKKYEAEPAKYKEQVEAQRKALAHMPKVQETCPLSGKPIKKDAFVESD